MVSIFFLSVRGTEDWKVATEPDILRVISQFAGPSLPQQITASTICTRETPFFVSELAERAAGPFSSSANHAYFAPRFGVFWSLRLKK